jgi:hypothetical protein
VKFELQELSKLFTQPFPEEDMAAEGGAPVEAEVLFIPGAVAAAEEFDGGAVDGGAVDGGAVAAAEEFDGGAVDGGAVDGGAVDGGAVDGGAVDGGAVAAVIWPLISPC